MFVSTSLMGFDTTQLAHVVCSKQYGRYHTSKSGHFLFYFLFLFPIMYKFDFISPKDFTKG